MRRSSLAIVGILFVAACSAPAAAPLSKMPRDIALTTAHVEPGFILVEDRERTLDTFALEVADPETAIADLAAHGYLGGWYREFRKVATLGLFQISSNCGAYKNADGAKWAYASNVQETLGSDPPAALVPLGEVIGDESVAYRLGTPGPDPNTTFTAYFIYFRFRNISNTVTGAGVGPGVDLQTVIALARQQFANQR